MDESKSPLLHAEGEAKAFPSSDSIVDKAIQEREKLEKAILRQEELIKQQENMMARQALSGRSESGFKQVEMSPEQKLDNEINNFFKGSGFDPLKPFRK